MILQVRAEMLHECDFLMQLFWIRAHIMHLHHVLLLRGRYRFPLIVVESGLRALVEQDLSGVVEEDPGGAVR